ncbi:MAG: hypothetical protein ACK5EO_00520 [Planctomycetota bacterium]
MTLLTSSAQQGQHRPKCHRRQAAIVVGTFHVPSTSMNQGHIELLPAAQQVDLSVASDATPRV